VLPHPGEREWLSARHSPACSYMEGDRYVVLLGGYGRNGAPLNGKGLACTLLEMVRSNAAAKAISTVYEKGAAGRGLFHCVFLCWRGWRMHAGLRGHPCMLRPHATGDACMQCVACSATPCMAHAVEPPDGAIIKVCEAAAQIKAGAIQEAFAQSALHLPSVAMELLSRACTYASQHPDVLLTRCLPLVFWI
jgi:hypothetical protein